MTNEASGRVETKVYLPVRDHLALQSIARDEGSSVTALVRQAVREYLLAREAKAA